MKNFKKTRVRKTSLAQALAGILTAGSVFMPAQADAQTYTGINGTFHATGSVANANGYTAGTDDLTNYGQASSETVSPNPITSNAFSMTGGTGATGGTGGVGGSLDLPSTGTGGNGGQGVAAQHGGSLDGDLSNPYTNAGGTITLTGGAGGAGGQGGDGGPGWYGGTGGAGGTGGTGGNGGDVTLRGATVNFQSTTLTLTSGAGGGTNGPGYKVDPTRGGVGGSGGAGGDGGNVSFIVLGDLNISGTSSFDFVKGLQNDATNASTLNMSVNNGTLNVAANSTLSMIFGANPLTAADNISFNTLELQSGSVVDAFGAGTNKGVVGALGTNAMGSGGGISYLVGNLVVHNNSSWLTDGTYAPNTAGNNMVTFDMTGVVANNNAGAPMLTMISGANNGAFGLTDFDPVAQHSAWLAGATGSQPVIWAPTLTLDSGTIMLVDRTDGVSPFVGTDNHYLNQEAADWFTSAIGLRAYTWDLWVDANDPDGHSHPRRC